MPNIVEFNATDNTPLRADSQGSNAFAQEGRRVGAFYHQIGQDLGQDIRTTGDTYVQHQEAMEASNLYKTSTDLEVNLQKAWQTYSTDPANKGRPDLASSFMTDHAAPLIQEWGTHAQTDKGKLLAAEMGSRITTGLFRTTAADQSDLDGEAWHEATTGTINNLGSGVASGAIPLDIAQGVASNMIHDTIPASVSASRRAEMEGALNTFATQQLTMAHYKGLAEAGREQLANGATASPALDQMRQDIAKGVGAGDLPPETFAGLTATADEAETRGKDLYKSTQAAARQGIEDQGRGDYVQITNEINEAIRGGRAVDPAVLQAAQGWADKYGKYLPGENTSLQSMMDRSITDSEALKFQKSDPRTLETYNRRALLAPGQPGALSDADIDKAVYVDHSLSPDAGRDLHETLRNQNNPAVNEGLKSLDQWLSTAIRPQLTRSAPLNGDGSINLLAPSGTDLKGDAAWAEAQRYAHAVYKAQLAAGSTPDQAVQRAIDPTSPHYMGHMLTYWQQGKGANDPAAFFGAHPQPVSADDFKRLGWPEGGGVVHAEAAAGEDPAAYLKRVRGH